VNVGGAIALEHVLGVQIYTVVLDFGAASQMI
jgi:hypothetical protein